LLLFFIVSVLATIDTSPKSDVYRWNLLQVRTQQVKALRAVTLLRNNGIEPILIKGVAAGRYYPEDDLRDCIDVDLAVAAEDYDRALEIARSDAADGFAIDLHCELRHLDTVEWKDLLQNSIELEFTGGSVRVLRPEDHLRVLCVHWLTDGGVNQDRLRDIYYTVENREPDFDWSRFLDPVSKRRKRWLTCTIGLAHRFLGLEVDDTPVAESAGDLPLWLIKTVEREWASDTKPWPLEASMYDPAMLLSQVKRRMRPNPIWATVQMEGSFDARTRVFYQAANIVKRVPSSCRRIYQTLKLKRG
jgi:putative nucleotidyltransferase-like protein